MDRKQKVLILLLILASVFFVLFVAIMQNQFNNPEFNYRAESASTSEKQSEHNNENSDDKEEPTDAKENEDTSEDESNGVEDQLSDEDEQTEEVIEEDRTVNADLLNVRRGPSADHQISGILNTGDIVTVYDDGNDWIEIEYGDISGYVNRNFLDSID